MTSSPWPSVVLFVHYPQSEDSWGLCPTIYILSDSITFGSCRIEIIILSQISRVFRVSGLRYFLPVLVSVESLSHNVRLVSISLNLLTEIDLVSPDLLVNRVLSVSQSWTWSSFYTH